MKDAVDEYALQSQMRTAATLEAGKLDDGAFACQGIYCRDQLVIDPAIYNVIGGGMGAAGLFEVA